MSWLDGLIQFISPERAVKREAWRQTLEQMRNYDAASYGNGSANWRSVNEAAEATDRYSRDIVRARARDLERNSDMMNAIIGAYTRNVIGGGYNLQAKTDNEELNAYLEKAWRKWCKKEIVM